jgi:hypothetical protein
MKPQDIVFIIGLVFVLYKRNPTYATVIGLVLLLLSIPLFYLQIFFTAQRFVMYAAGFLLVSAVFHLFMQRIHDRMKK